MLKNKSIYKASSYLLLVICMLAGSCLGTRDLSVVNLSNMYRNADRFFHPDLLIVHQSDSTSRLLVNLNTKELLFSRQSDDKFRAFFTIRYRLVEAYESINQVLDSGSVSFQVEEEEKNQWKIFEASFKMPKKAEMLLMVTIHDDQKKFEEQFYESVDNTSFQSRQSFVAYRPNEKTPLFRNYISTKDSVRIAYRNPAVKELQVRVYSRSFPLAPPPFSFDARDEFDYRPDSTYRVSLTDTVPLSFTKNGFYHFQQDTSDRNGFTLFVFHHSFPAVTSPEQMLECVRYLTTKREFEDMKANPNKKAAMDKFWLDLGGNSERSKILIKKYYTRIREANQFFTSYTEGWRTDRGLVYTVFGKPNNVYKNSNAESWIYGTPNSALSINFYFVKVVNPFTDNDFQLTREPLFEGSWMRAVDVWRQGRVYNDN